MKNIFEKLGEGVGDWIGTQADVPGAPVWLRGLRHYIWGRDGSRFSHDSSSEWSNYLQTEREYNADRNAFSCKPMMLKIRGLFARRTPLGVNYYSYEHPPVLDNFGSPVIDRKTGEVVLKPDVIMKHRFTDYGPGIAMSNGLDLDPRIVKAAVYAAYVKNGQRPLERVFGSQEYRRVAYACAMELGVQIKSDEFQRYVYEMSSYHYHQSVDQGLGMNMS